VATLSAGVREQFDGEYPDGGNRRAAGASGGRPARAVSPASMPPAAGPSTFAERPLVRIAMNNRDPVSFRIPP
jgi:hypothetical protein